MQIKKKTPRTPSGIMMNIVAGGIKATGMTMGSLAKSIGCSANTLTGDFQDPERVPQKRLWLYFTALGIPIEDVLRAIAYSVADKSIER